MSFSSKTKNELSRLTIENTCCLMAELAAIVRMNGTLQINGINKIKIKFSTENPAIARRIFSLLKEHYDFSTEVRVRRNSKLKKNNSYLMVVSDTSKARKLMEDVKVLQKNQNQLYSINYRIPESIFQKKCCKRAYIRGAFLGGGSISDPEKTYHLEFVNHNQEHSEDLSKLINSFGLNSKTISRKDNYIVYIKEGEQIVDLLNIMGAHSSLLKLENIRVVKEMRNNINRIVNCETANLSKTINAAVRQINNIKYIDKVMGIEKLPPNIREIAELRLMNREASLKELGQMLSTPVGKSGVNHRLRKLEKIAERLKKERGDL
ncbi:DNA-binding protein WhiA [Caldisalinibacter kiritimatiensis]|uniref:Probable cell division protein WhiA n=1 Tax=Caldisalinibacter kiritimatiensis TaxID=1304284 RepID=R1CEX6_9FIRM|nr:DNA-binding protein WhiA [Caldisalinibacter kiritimatiensis]EOD00860.1 hypothetical protein L21TH_1098 [Caldisalinibacter kiritimatiensis]